MHEALRHGLEHFLIAKCGQITTSMLYFHSPLTFALVFFFHVTGRAKIVSEDAT